MNWFVLTVFACMVFGILFAHWLNLRKIRAEMQREQRIRQHLRNKAMSWSIETQNDRTPFMSDFPG